MWKQKEFSYGSTASQELEKLKTLLVYQNSNLNQSPGDLPYKWCLHRQTTIIYF